MTQRQVGPVGRGLPRSDGLAKASGRARYIDDHAFPGMLHARTIRSTVPRARIRAIAFASDPAGFTIVGARDIPGRNVISLIEDDQPCLAERDQPAHGKGRARACRR